VDGQRYGARWWCEGEVKIYLDGDAAFPTLAGTGAEDYIGTGYGLGAYSHLYQGAPVADFSNGHIPGAVSIPLRPQFASWLGWLAPPGTPLLVVRNEDQDPEEIAWQACKVGYDQLAGELVGGMSAWRAVGAPTSRVPLVTAEQLSAMAAEGNVEVLDVRQDSEFRAGHVPGARHVELGTLAERAAHLPPRPTVVMCGHGERAMGAASLLARAGRSEVAVLAGGPQDWSRATSRSLATGA